MNAEQPSKGTAMSSKQRGSTKNRGGTLEAQFFSDEMLLKPWLSIKNALGVILDALHYSRRLQAERILLRYRDLIDPVWWSIVRERDACSEEHQSLAQMTLRNEALSPTGTLMQINGARPGGAENSGAPFWQAVMQRIETA